MIWKIGTDCSGIEAPIQALLQLNIKHKHIFSSDIDKHVIKSIKANYNPLHIFNDITIRDMEKVPDIDIYVCGFPCQTFSLIGNREGFLDKRGIVFFSCLDVIKNKNPKFFILENVKGLFSHNKGKTFQTILEHLESLENYSIYWEILNTKDYGIPQNRSRIFFVGIRTDVQTQPFNFPDILPMKNINSFIDNNNNNKQDAPNRIKSTNYLSKIPKHSVFVDFSLYGHSTFPTSDKYTPCILRKSEFWCVPKHRHASCEELLSLQGFPTTLKQSVSTTQFKYQIGNSMSVNVLKSLFTEIFKSMLFTK
jgi:DNA (cytosine-5)-methyltransferase 1